jgi:hypothetical protein
MYGGLEVAFARGERGLSLRGPLGGSCVGRWGFKGGGCGGVGDGIWPGVV